MKIEGAIIYDRDQSDPLEFTKGQDGVTSIVVSDGELIVYSDEEVLSKSAGYPFEIYDADGQFLGAKWVSN